ncbi:MAG: TonB-dependent receptor [Puniceicoccales bacterium]|jgi:outer membrane receptor protein involved in Fe transport|nr:TonB-dependent receptor [Puniceicoccales bacterium]
MSSQTSLITQKNPKRLALAFLVALAALPFATIDASAQSAPATAPQPDAAAPTAPAQAPAPTASAPTAPVSTDEATVLEGVRIDDIPADQSILPTRPSQSLYGFEETIRETPRSVFQISKTQLNNDVIQSFTDFSRYSPSIQRGSTSPYSAPRIRGGTADTLRNNIVLFNTVVRPFNTNAWESVDIVPGIPSVVQGNTTRTAGYVNLITKKPFLDSDHTELSFTLGRVGLTSRTTYPQASVTLDHSNVLIENKLAIRVSLLEAEHNLYWGNAQADTKDLFLALAYRPTENLSFDANFTYTKSSGAPPLGINRITQNLIDNWQYNANTYSPVYAYGGVNYTLNAAGNEFVGANGTHYGIGAVPWTAANPAVLANWAQGPANNVKIRGDQTIYGAGSDNNADEYIAQTITTYRVDDVFTVRNNTVFQYSDNVDHAYDLSYSQHVNKLFETRFELLSNKDFTLFGLPIRHQSNSGGSFRFLSNTCDGFAPIGAASPLTYADATNAGSYGVTSALGGSPSDYLGKLPATTSGFYTVADTAYGPIRWIPSVLSGGIYRGVPIGPGSGFGTAINLGATERRTNQLKTTNFFTEHKFDIGEFVTWRAGARISYISDSIDSNSVTRRLVSQGYYSGLNLTDSATAWAGDINTSLTFRIPGAQWISTYVAYDYNKAGQDCGCCQTQGFFGPGNTLADSYFDVRSELYEIGAKFEIIPNSLFASFAWFHQTRNVATSDAISGAQSTNPLIYQGVEFAVAWQPTAHATLGANYSYIDASYERTGGRYEGSPLNSFNLWGSYQFDNGFGVKANFWVNSSWNVNVAGTLKVPTQLGLNAGVFYNAKTWRLDVDVTNLTDEKNWSSGGGLAGNSYSYLLPAERLGVSAKFTYRF